MASTYIYDYVKFRPHFDTLADLTADTSLAYAATGNKYRVDVGDYVTAGSANYVVIASGGTAHETTAGGVKLYEAGPAFSTRARLVNWYGEGYTVPDGTIFSAAGVFYEAESGNTSIADLNGWKELLDTSSTSVAVEDDGASVVATASTLNFAGRGVSVTDAGSGQADIEVPGDGRNLIINGDMRIAQRSAQVTGITASGYHTVDRWNLELSGLGTWTMDYDTDVPASSGFTYSAKLTCTSADASPAAGDRLIFQQKIEGLVAKPILRKGSAGAKDMAVSFWVKSDKTGTYVVEIYDTDNTRHICEAVTISSADTWEEKRINLPGDTSGAITDDNNESLQFNLWLGAGSNYTSGTLATAWAGVTAANRAVGQANLADSTNYLSITGVQLETVESSGGLGTAFEFHPLDQSLVRCRRYYWQITGNGSDYIALFTGWCLANNDVRCTVQFPTEMRAAPSVTESALRTQGFSASATDISLNTAYYADTQSLAIAFAPDAGTPFTAGTSGEIGLYNTTASYIAFSAEL